MKNKLFYFALFSLAILFGCNKYESYSKKIVGGWIINKYIVDSENKTDYLKELKKNYVISFFEDKSYTETYIDTNNVLLGNLGTYIFNQETDSLFLYNQTDTSKFKISSINSNAINLKQELLVNGTNTFYIYQFVRK